MTERSTKTPATRAKTLTIERVFNASPERLWEFWTDPKKFAKWFNPAAGMDLVIHEFDPRPGGRSRFDMPQPDGNPNPQEGVFHSLTPYREIVAGAPDKSFLIKVTFEPVGTKQARMTVRVTGVPAEYHEGATKGWNQGFDKLAKLLEAGSAPTPGHSDAPRVTIERTFKAPPRKLWEMWTMRAGLEKWWIPPGWTSTVTHLDLRVGGQYEITMKSGGQTIRNHGTYTRIEPKRRLAYTWNYDIFLSPGEKPYDVPISVEFQEVPGGTKVTFTQGPLATREFTEGSRKGVLSNFDKLGKALEV